MEEMMRLDPTERATEEAEARRDDYAGQQLKEAMEGENAKEAASAQPGIPQAVEEEQPGDRMMPMASRTA